MYYLSECLIIKNENQYLLEHIRDNVQAGIEHFYIYDNLSDKPVEEFLKENSPDLLNICTIEIFQEDNKEMQEHCYAKFLNDHRNDTQWVTFTDTDEIYEGDLFSLCHQNEDKVAGFYFDGIIHGCNGHVWANDKTMKENYYDDVSYIWFYRKCCIQTKFIKEQLVHKTILNTDKEIIIIKNDLNEKVKLHHYYYKSFEEWCIKVMRGSMHRMIAYSVWNFFRCNSELPHEEINKVLKKYNLNLLWTRY